jgi:hypothetical protein
MERFALQIPSVCIDKDGMSENRAIAALLER